MLLIPTCRLSIEKVLAIEFRIGYETIYLVGTVLPLEIRFVR